MAENATTDAQNSNSTTGVVLLEMLESGIALIKLGSPEERALTLSASRLNSFKEALLHLKANLPKGLVITGPSAEMFCVGADITIIQSITKAEEGEKLARQGQEIFELLESLPFKTVAAISGPCVGGGCELVLGCKYRIISDLKGSQIGLPETKLGILPGFGGTQRLPKLIGLPRALEVILAGRTLKPKQAVEYGLVNEVVSVHKLKERAELIALGRMKEVQVSIPFLDRILTHTKFGRNRVRASATRRLLAETKGFYPAPPAALECCIQGLEKGLAEGSKLEAKELGRLIITPESKNLVRVFFLGESAKRLGRSARKSVDHVHAIVIGAGTMGQGIALSLARNECSVILKDANDENLKRGLEGIKASLDRIRYLSDTDKSFVLNRIESANKDVTSIGNATIALEAVFEDLELKKKVFTEVSKNLPQDAILASNTSSLSISAIAKELEHPERVIGMHFFNPVERMPLVEVVVGQKTADRVIAIIAALAVRLGKYPIVVQDVPGFLVNRMLIPYLNEAAFLIQEGHSIQAVDAAALAFGMPMGPLRLLDEVGLDVASHVSQIMLNGYGERMKAPGLSKLFVEQGFLGKKKGGGFYLHEGKTARPNPNIQSILKIQNSIKDAKPEELTERLILPIVHEAVRCMDESVAGKPGPEAAAQIDLGSIMGFGFPAFRGGVLTYATSIGSAKLNEKLQKLHKTHGIRFQPSDALKHRAKGNKALV